jgi:hypothetical protein
LNFIMVKRISAPHSFCFDDLIALFLGLPFLPRPWLLPGVPHLVQSSPDCPWLPRLHSSLCPTAGVWFSTYSTHRFLRVEIMLPETFANETSRPFVLLGQPPSLTLTLRQPSSCWLFG